MTQTAFIHRARPLCDDHAGGDAPLRPSHARDTDSAPPNNCARPLVPRSSCAPLPNCLPRTRSVG
jgi:hypothetical protein